MPSLTIIVPTFNRSQLLKSCLEFIRKQDSSIQLVVADSSIEKEKAVNRETVQGMGARINYLEFDLEIQPLEKLRSALGVVATEYACLCADDDLIVVKTALESVGFLARNSDYVACHGYYLRYSLTNSKSMLLEDWEYRGPSLTATTASGRAIDLLSNYEALFYSVQATPMLRMSLEAMTTSPYIMHQELANALWLVLAGKIKRIDRIYNLRQAGIATRHSLADHYSFIAERFPSLTADYAFMVEKLVAKFKSVLPERDEGNLLQSLQFGFMVYLYKSVNFIVLARQMIPNYPESDLRPLRQIRPPSFRPSGRFVLDEFIERGMCYLKERVLRRMAPIAIHSNANGHPVYISRVLNNGLTSQYREEIRQLF